MSSDNPAIATLRGQYQMAHFWVEGTMEGVTAEQAAWDPPGLAHSAGTNYAHLVVGEDALLSQFIAGKAPLIAGDWAGKTGLSEPPPASLDWEDWSRRVQIDLPALREYAQAVYANTDGILAALTDADLARPLDLSPVKLGQQSVGFLVSLMIGNAFAHCGEISAAKGNQGMTGYPL
jgi:hypothetical protein